MEQNRPYLLSKYYDTHLVEPYADAKKYKSITHMEFRRNLSIENSCCFLRVKEFHC